MKFIKQLILLLFRVMKLEKDIEEFGYILDKKASPYDILSRYINQKEWENRIQSHYPENTEPPEWCRRHCSTSEPC